MATVIIVLMIMAISETATSCEKGHLHLIVFAQDEDTEISVKIGDAKREKELVDAGVTYLSYRTDATDVEILAYGDSIKPRVDKGRDGEYYSIICIKPPEESVGE